MSLPSSILLVEDHADTLNLLARLLRIDGHTVEAALNVRDALRLADGRRPDLLISDIGLPDGTGLELLGELRRTHGELPAIALTGYGEERDAEQCRLAGFRAHLVKPVTYERLSKAIDEISARAGANGGPDDRPAAAAAWAL